VRPQGFIRAFLLKKMGKRQTDIKKDLSTAHKLIDKKKKLITKLKKEINYLEYPKNELGHAITAGGCIYGE